MLEIELEYQRQARKVYLYNYIFRLPKPSSSERANSSQHAENAAGLPTG